MRGEKTAPEQGLEGGRGSLSGIIVRPSVRRATGVKEGKEKGGGT